MTDLDVLCKVCEPTLGDCDGCPKYLEALGSNSGTPHPWPDYDGATPWVDAQARLLEEAEEDDLEDDEDETEYSDWDADGTSGLDYVRYKW